MGCYQHCTTQWHTVASGLQHEAASLSISDPWSLCFLSHKQQSHWEKIALKNSKIIWQTGKFLIYILLRFRSCRGAFQTLTFLSMNYHDFRSCGVVSPLVGFIGILLINCLPRTALRFFFFSLLQDFNKQGPFFPPVNHLFSLKNTDYYWIVFFVFFLISPTIS